MRAYSKDLRLRVLAVLDRGMPRKELANNFGVSVSTVKRYLKLRRETGEVELKPIPGPRAQKRASLEERLPAQVRLNPDLTLSEHCELSSRRGARRRGLHRHREPGSERPRAAAQKKTLGSSSERDEGERAAFREQAGSVDSRVVDSRLFVWVDECGTHIFHDATAGTSAQGREGLRERAQESGQEHRADSQHDPRGPRGGDGGASAMAVEGSTRAFVFEAYVEERFLAPSLRPGQIVMMDNLGAHKTERVRELIEERGCRGCGSWRPTLTGSQSHRGGGVQ